MNDVLTWMVFQGAVCYARKKWEKKFGPMDSWAALDHYTETWEHIWRLQRALGCPPVGLIRSC